MPARLVANHPCACGCGLQTRNPKYATRACAGRGDIRHRNYPNKYKQTKHTQTVGCVHYWVIPSESTDGYYTGECKLCKQTRKFPIPDV